MYHGSLAGGSGLGVEGVESLSDVAGGGGGGDAFSFGGTLFPWVFFLASIISGLLIQAGPPIDVQDPALAVRQLKVVGSYPLTKMARVECAVGDEPLSSLLCDPDSIASACKSCVEKGIVCSVVSLYINNIVCWLLTYTQMLIRFTLQLKRSSGLCHEACRGREPRGEK